MDRYNGSCCMPFILPIKPSLQVVGESRQTLSETSHPRSLRRHNTLPPYSSPSTCRTHTGIVASRAPRVESLDSYVIAILFAPHRSGLGTKSDYCWASPSSLLLPFVWIQQVCTLAHCPEAAPRETCILNILSNSDVPLFLGERLRLRLSIVTPYREHSPGSTTDVHQGIPGHPLRSP